jgi:hypothetical protein
LPAATSSESGPIEEIHKPGVEELVPVIRVKAEPLEHVIQGSESVLPFMEKLVPVSRVMVEPPGHMDLDYDDVAPNTVEIGPVIEIKKNMDQNSDDISPSGKKLGPVKRVLVPVGSQARVDQDSDVSPNVEKRYVCSKCSVIVKSLNSLKRHVGIFLLKSLLLYIKVYNVTISVVKKVIGRN